METSQLIKSVLTETRPDISGPVFPEDEQKRITDLFSILIKIDQRLKAKESNENQD